jgi:phosphoglucosamine mutase
MSKFPQVLINVPVQGSAKPILDLPQVGEALRECEAALNGRGRILLRASGTEPLIRVMVEAQDGVETLQTAERLAEAVKRAAAG